jgi:cytochrome oxidase Cu insertion factor (SCO1/SenC/PrrC family)
MDAGGQFFTVDCGVANREIDLGSAAPDAPAPDFHLRDQNGHWRSPGQLRGKAVLLAFVDSLCTRICPLTSESMVRALRLICRGWR